jgi:hypothetical protein
VLSISEQRVKQLAALQGVDVASAPQMRSTTNPTDVRCMLEEGVNEFVIDEAQDLPPTLFEQFTRTGPGREVGLCLFFDLNQTNALRVAPTKEAEERQRLTNSLMRIPHVQSIHLAINYRNSREIAEHVRERLRDQLPWTYRGEAPAFECGEVAVLTAANEGDLLASVLKSVAALRREFAPGEIAVLWCGGVAGSWRRLLHALEGSALPVSSHVDATGRILVNTAIKVKGHERRAVIAVVRPGDRPSKFKHAIATYIGLTRARDRVVVIETLIQEASELEAE